jgi:Flp pilus assembly pilin Flp
VEQVRIQDERGQTMAEYGVVLAMITVGVLAALIAFRDGILAGFMRAVDLLS